jgi:hypothetical protein
MFVALAYNIYKSCTFTKQYKTVTKQGYFSNYFVLNIETKIFYQYKKTNIVYFLFHIKSEFTNLVTDLDIHQLSQFEYIFL